MPSEGKVQCLQRALGTLELEVQVVLSQATWLLGTISCPLKERYTLLTAESPLQPHTLFDFLMVMKEIPFSGNHTLNLAFGSSPRLALWSVILSGDAG